LHHGDTEDTAKTKSQNLRVLRVSVVSSRFSLDRSDTARWAANVSETPSEPIVPEYAAAPSAAIKRAPRQKRICLSVFYAAAALMGAANRLVEAPTGNLIDLVLGGIAAFSVLFWVQFDAAEHESRVGLGLRLMVLVLMPLGFAIYCLTRRRFLTLLLGAVALLGCFATIGVVSLITSSLP
jgi:hypothetical protein